jgi:hypothetical protein
MWAKYLLLVGGTGTFTVAMALVTYDLCVAYRFRKAVRGRERLREPQPAPWRVTAALIAMSWAPMLIALSLLRRG